MAESTVAAGGSLSAALLARCEPLFKAAADARVAHAVADRAAAYRREPWQLDMIEEGLSALPPRERLARLNEIWREDRCLPRPCIGFGGTIPLINLRGAIAAAELEIGDEVK